MKKQTKLENGLTIITKHNENDNSVMLNYWVKVGGNNEKDYPYGIAHFLEHNMFKGTKKRSKNEIKEELEGVGGILNASTGSNVTNYHTIVPYTKWENGIEVLSDMMFNSVFPEEEVEKEKKVVLEEIKRSKDNFASYGFRVMIKEIFENHPERQSVLGNAESVSSITRENLVKFVDEFYQPENMVFVATGNVDHEKVVEKIEKLIPKKSKVVKPLKTELKMKEFNSQTVNITKDTSQAHLMFGLYGPTSKDKEETYICEILSGILGGGMTSRLFKSIREEKGLAYSVNASFTNSNDYGLMCGYVGTSPENVEQVKELIKEEFEYLKDHLVEEKELTKVKNMMSGRYLISNDSKQVQNSLLAYNYFFEEEDDPKKYAEELNKVTPEKIKEVANKYFSKDKFLFVQITPENK